MASFLHSLAVSVKKLCATIGAFFLVSGMAVLTVAAFAGPHRLAGGARATRARGGSTVVLQAAVVRHPTRETPSRPR